MLMITSAAEATLPSSCFALHSKKKNYRPWQYILAFLFILYNVHCPVCSDEIPNFLKRCCSGGIEYAHKNTFCKDYDFEIDAIQPLWRDLCLSTYGMCCTGEIQQLHCAAGRNAAITGSRCDEDFRTPAYSACCRSCQAGLTATAADEECDDLMFSDDESFKICCRNNEAQAKYHKEHKPKHRDEGNAVYESSEISFDEKSDEEDTYGGKSVETPGDGATVLQNGDNELCGQVPIQCEHICVSTKNGYECRCNHGYKLNDDNITCSPITSQAQGQHSEIKLTVSNNATHKESMDTYDDEYNPDEEKNEVIRTSTFDGNGKDSGETCPIGYEREHGICVDIDECARAKCRSNQYCHNTPGSYRCQNIKTANCPTGYRFSARMHVCEDINECEEDIDDCAREQECINLWGSFKCVCRSGFQFKNGGCIDIDECVTDENACDSTQYCRNDIGSFHCNCKPGFSPDATTDACVDIDECSINNHNCLSSQRCDNTPGSYICTRLLSCGTGYTLNAQTNNCDDDDECASNTHNCTPDYVCYNTMGSFRCRPVRHKPTKTTPSTTTITTSTTKCPLGFQQNDLGACVDINECEEDEDACDSTQVCRNDIGSFYCICKIGFSLDATAGTCVDDDECASNTHNCTPNSVCYNTMGSFSCRPARPTSRTTISSTTTTTTSTTSQPTPTYSPCGIGFQRNYLGTCVDIDECDAGVHNCAEDQICRNRDGGYLCFCQPGHEFTRLLNANNRCVDINECEQEHPAVCPSNAQCLNTIGSYYCECKSGFQKSRENHRICLDMDECQEIPGLCQQKCVNFWGGYRCTCNAGYELSPDNRTCNDLDECEVHKSYKLCMGYCNNVPGSYECSCPRGYTLEQDKKRCRDIDECATSDVCTGRNDICTNIRGSYKCTTIQCPYGYVNDPDQKNRCRPISNSCEGDDCYNKPSAYTYNFITLVSKLLIPPEGRTIFSLHGPVWYDDIDFDLKIVKIQAAANIEKASDYDFDTIEGKHDVQVTLKRSLEGPQNIELELSMSAYTKGLRQWKRIAKIFITVSQYSF